jgi:hypothetical protein
MTYLLTAVKSILKIRMELGGIPPVEDEPYARLGGRYK